MYRKFLFIVAVLASSLCFGEALQEYDYDILEAIIANEMTCVQKIDNGKIYLNPTTILPSSTGIFLNLNETESILLSYLYSDSEGCYLWPKIPPQILNTCPWCGEEYFVRCRNPDCPGKSK